MKRARPEAAIQKTLIDILKLTGVPDLWFSHIANNPRSAIAGANLKRLGAVAGTPDLLLIADGRVNFLELKAPRGRLSPAQACAHAALRRAGARVETAYGIDHAIEVLKRWRLLRGEVV